MLGTPDSALSQRLPPPLEPRAGGETPAPVELIDLWYRYGEPAPCAGSEAWILQQVDLQLQPGELVGLLGPSGCGKTTLLRLIAGFERPKRGVVRLAGREVAGPGHWLPPERRGVGMVFQDHALFPHLDAWRNVCFGLRRGQDSSRAAWLLELLGLGGLERRYPHELSGGQRQRLALARALAPGCSLLLLDEPFSNLDVEVRLRLRAELPAVLAECGTSGVIVTHDPEEALAICDRVAVLEKGRLHQCASPRELVSQPATPFVGRFVLQGNLLPARWQGSRLQTPLGWLEPCQAPSAHPATACQPLEVLVAPHSLDWSADPEGNVRVLSREFHGRDWLARMQVGKLSLRVRLPLDAAPERGQRGHLTLRSGEPARLFPEGLALRALALPPGESPVTRV